MAAVSLFWDTNMADVTSCENTLYPNPLSFIFLFFSGWLCHFSTSRLRRSLLRNYDRSTSSESNYTLIE